MRPARRHAPPWWPEGEAWPPRGRPAWRRRRPPAFLLPIGCGLAGAGFLLGVLFAGAFAWHTASGVPPFTVPALLVLALFAVLVAGWSRRLRLRTRAADRRRRAFLADVAHEFRTPLSVIRGQAEALADGIYPPDAEHVAPIVESVRTLERLVDDLRTLTQTEAGALELRREPVDLRALAADVAAGLAADAARSGVSLAVTVPPGLPPADADPARLRSVLGNLLTNAIRHTPSGGSVEVTAAHHGAQLEVAVEDTGAGIDPELLPRVFDRFVKGEGSPGSGLGLAIARDLVEAHEGTIEARNRPRGGAAVRFTLPAAER